MKKRVLILILEFFICSVLIAKQISFIDANIIAENWTRVLEEKFDDQVRIKDGREIYRDGIIVAYVFDFYPKGYVIISAQDYLPPIKMYSLKNDFNTTGGPLEELVFSRLEYIIDKVDKGEMDPKIHFLKRNKRDFSYLLRGDIIHEGLSSLKADITEEVEPLLTSRWGQGSPYNDNCPVIEDVRAPTGCVATSWAQILNYYEWPDRGLGSLSYYDPEINKTIYTNFDKEYQWWNILDEYNYSNDPEENQNAVAELMYDTAVALQSGFGKFSTGASYYYINNFVTHLKYSPDLKVQNWFDYKNDDLWFSIIKNQLDNGWPFKYSVSGSCSHSVAIDGYRISDGANTVHINFGWKGDYNGYFSLDFIYINDELYFDYNKSMVINIYPYPSYKRPVGKTPTEIHGYAYLNRSVFLSEYFCKLTWSESPSEDKRIYRYIIYRQKNGSTEELGRVEPSDSHVYEFRAGDYNEYVYSVGVIDKNGTVSDIPGFINLELKN